MKIATEGALWGSRKAHGLLPNTVIVSDDAGQFNVGRHGPCWVQYLRGSWSHGTPQTEWPPSNSRGYWTPAERERCERFPRCWRTGHTRIVGDTMSRITIGVRRSNA